MSFYHESLAHTIKMVAESLQSEASASDLDTKQLQEKTRAMTSAAVTDLYRQTTILGDTASSAGKRVEGVRGESQVD